MSNTAVTFAALPNQYILVRDAVVVYEPSVFGGNGEEKRKNLVLSVPEIVRVQLRSIEEDLVLGHSLCSVIKDDGSIRVKLDTDAVRIFDGDHTVTTHPTQWKGVTINVLLEIKGQWKSRSGAGLSVLCTDIQLSTAVVPVVSPFA